LLTPAAARFAALLLLTFGIATLVASLACGFTREFVGCDVAGVLVAGATVAVDVAGVLAGDEGLAPLVVAWLIAVTQ